MYHLITMRRGLSILLVLLFGLWPLAGTLEAGDDSRLPQCCRRHGAHHCAMTAQMAAAIAEAASGSTPMLAAPMTCPLFPGFAAGPSTPSHAMATPVTSLAVLPAQVSSLVASRTGARMRPIRTHAGRGPPASTLS